MSSSEEYLDNLLKSIMEGNNTSNTEDTLRDPDAEQVQSVPDEVNIPEEFALNDLTLPEEPAGGAESVDMSVESEGSDSDKVTAMEEIESMLASMGSLDPDKPTAEKEPETPVMAEDKEPETSVMAEDAEADPDLSAISAGIGQGPESLAIEEPLEDSSLEMPMLNEEDEQGNGLDDLDLSELGLDDFGLEESVAGTEAEPDDFMRDDALENLPADSGEQSDVSLDDISLDDLSFGEPSLDMETEEGDMSEEDIDRLLSGESISNNDYDSSEEDALSLDDLSMTEDSEPVDGLALADDFALEDYGESDEDLSALLAGMEQNEDLSEINDLLGKSDQGVSTDDDMLAMLESVPGSDADESGSDAFNFFAGEEAVEGEPENIREITQEELENREESKKAKKEKKKREKKAKKERKKKDTVEGEDTAEAEEAATLESLLEGTTDAAETPKKQGLFARFLAFLFEEDENEETLADHADGDVGLDELPIGNPSEENKQLLEELNEEDKKNAKKKGKKEKKDKKDKKDKKGKKASAETGEEEDAENEEKNKAKKKKKKKEKNPVEEVHNEPEKKLSKKKVIAVFLYCATMAACIIVIDTVLPNYMQKRDARIAFDCRNYDEVYDLLYGKKLSEEDELLLKKSSIILQMERKLDSCENYEKLDMPLEALDALVSGVDLYQTILPGAEQYHVTGDVSDIYDQILQKLSDYGVSESEALDIIASGDDVTYSQRLEGIIYGGASMESVAGPTPDILPEEEEIIDRMEQLEESDVADGEDENGDAAENGESGELTDLGDDNTEEAEQE